MFVDLSSLFMDIVIQFPKHWPKRAKIYFKVDFYRQIIHKIFSETSTL